MKWQRVIAHNVSAWAQYTIRVPNRESIQEKLKVAGVPTAVHYPTPLNKQPAVADFQAKLSVGDMVAESVLSLPMHPYLLTEQQASVVSSILSASGSAFCP